MVTMGGRFTSKDSSVGAGLSKYSISITKKNDYNKVSTPGAPSPELTAC